MSGIASFTGCRIARAGTYTLTATTPGLSPASSASFTISAGPAARVVVTASPGTSVRGVAFATQPAVAIQDAAGNVVPTTVFVALTITSPAGGAVLACFFNPILTSGGTGVFNGCRIDRAGTFSVTVTSSGLAPGQSATFVVE